MDKGTIRLGSKVKMWWEEDKKWYYGVVMDIADSDDSDDDVPIARFAKQGIKAQEDKGGESEMDDHLLI